MFKKLDLYTKDPKTGKYYHLGYLKGTGGEDIAFVATDGDAVNIEFAVNNLLTNIEKC